MRKNKEAGPNFFRAGLFRHNLLLQGSDKVVLLDVLEIPVGGDFQFLGGRFVADHDAFRMDLEGRDCPDMVV